MTHQEAIEQVKSQKDYHVECMADIAPGTWTREWQKKRVEALDIAIEALKAMPEYEKLKERDRAKGLQRKDADSHWLCCPNCKLLMACDNMKIGAQALNAQKFCPQCGQRIDWREQEDAR